ncbi:hypothetical protein EW145_g1106 [Phellinidium pouzarii]|uniref:Uncharacterized protein n=1 Tax=Phellinidium pouzarii TaxID=167371 RepID=A0A4S4LGC2_9AGAM|nr:hypothetical protein EW145_g1106 [Phellinidium pouzarii]
MGGSITLTIGSVLYRPKSTWYVLVGIAGAVEALAWGLALNLTPVRVNVVSSTICGTASWSRTMCAACRSIWTSRGLASNQEVNNGGASVLNTSSVLDLSKSETDDWPVTSLDRSIVHPLMAASLRHEGSFVVAVLEGQGIGHEVGIAALDKDTGRVSLIQLADCQTWTNVSLWLVTFLALASPTELRL